MPPDIDKIHLMESFPFATTLGHPFLRLPLHNDFLSDDRWQARLRGAGDCASPKHLLGSLTIPHSSSPAQKLYFRADGIVLY